MFNFQSDELYLQNMSQGTISLNSNSNITIESLPVGINIFDRIQSALLYLRTNQEINSAYLDKFVLKIIDNNSQIIVDNSQYVNKNAHDYLMFDVTEVYRKHRSENVLFVLYNNTSNFSLSISLSDSFVDFVTITPFEFLNNQKHVNNSIGSSFVLKQDIISSLYYLEKPIFNNIYKKQYSLVHDSYNPNDSQFLFFPKGWKLNIFEKIYHETISNDEFYNVLIDSSYNYHRFKPVYQGDVFMDCFIDISGTSLLMKYVALDGYPSNNNWGYKVFSPLFSAYKLYDPDGYLIKVVDENGEETTITYSLSQITITEPTGNTISILDSGLYDSTHNSILISSNVVSLLNYRLLISNEDNTLDEIIYKSHKEAPNFTFLNPEYQTNNDYFSYDSESNISHIQTFDNRVLDINIGSSLSTVLIKLNNNPLVNYQLLRNHHNSSTIIDCIKGTNYYYFYNDKGEVIISKENTDSIKDDDVLYVISEINKYKLGPKSIEKMISVDYIQGEEVPYYIENDYSTLEDATFYTNYIHTSIDIDLSDTNLYLLIVVIDQNRVYPSKFNNKRSTKVFLYDNSDAVEYDLIFTFDNDGIEAKSMIRTFNQARIKMAFRFFNNLGTSIIKGVYFIPILDINSATLYQSDTDELFKMINNNNYSSVKNINFYHEYQTHNLTNKDIRLNQILHIKGGNPSYFYTDDLTNVFVNISNPLININNIPTDISFNNQSFLFYQKRYEIEKAVEILSYSNLFKIQSYLIKGQNTYISYDAYNFHGDMCESMDYKGIKKTNTYDSSLNLLSINLIPNDNSSSLTNSFEYDSLNRLKKQLHQVEYSIVETSYTYIDDTNIINTIKDPRNKTTTHYYSINYEYLSKISKSNYSVGSELTKSMKLSTQFVGTSYPKYSYSYNQSGKTSSINRLYLDLGIPSRQRLFELMEFSVPIVNISYQNINDNGELITYSYPNNMDHFFYYDKYNRVTQTKTDGATDEHVTLFAYNENKGGTLSSIIEQYPGYNNQPISVTTNITYNDRNNISSISSTGGYANLVRTYTYDNNELLSSESEVMSGSSYLPVNLTSILKQYTRDLATDEVINVYSLVFSAMNGPLNIPIYFAVGVGQSIARDSLNRLASINTVEADGTPLIGFNIAYFSINNKTSNYINSIFYNHRSAYYSYSYNANGDVISISGTAGNGVTYSYDDNNQLISETHPNENYVINYTYDTRGNIVSAIKTNGSGQTIESHTYEYSLEYPDRLTKYNNNNVTYSDNLNPTLLNGATLSYDRVNMLSTYQSGNNNASYEYNYNGIRTKKSVNTITHYYVLDGNNITREIVEDSNSPYTKYQIIYLYGVNGIYGFIYNGNLYLYEKDIFNNVNAIYQKTSNGIILVAKYNYDAYGNTVVLNPDGTENTNSTFIGHINPFRYRSYYFDEESKYYYCNHRYYVPFLRRWLTMDDLSYLDSTSINGINLYAYCKNNPVMYIDSEGNMPKWIQWLIGGTLIVGAIAVSIFTAGVGGALAAAMGGGLLASIAGGTIAGAISGVVSGALLSAGIDIIFNKFSWESVFRGAVSGLITGAIAGGIFGGISHVFESTTIARYASSLDAARYELEHSFGTMRSIADLSKTPFASESIAKAIATSVANYNLAYTNYILAEAMYHFYQGVIEIAYFVGENWLADWLERFI